jgi:hypothetical protein
MPAFNIKLILWLEKFVYVWAQLGVYSPRDRGVFELKGLHLCWPNDLLRCCLKAVTLLSLKCATKQADAAYRSSEHLTQWSGSKAFEPCLQSKTQTRKIS